MNITECPNPQRLVDFLLGNLTECESEAIEEHLTLCRACGSTATSLDGVADTVVTGLRQARVPNPFVGEIEYQQAIEQLCEGSFPGSVHDGNLPGSISG